MEIAEVPLLRKEGEEMSNNQQKAIKWDEETIAEHDKERGTRQKIEEVDTPYERDQSAYEEEEAEDGGAGDVCSSRNNQVRHCTDLFRRLNAQLTYVQYRQQQAVVESSSVQAASLMQDSTNDEKIDKFREKRAGHYGRIDLTELRKINAERDD